MIAVQTYLEIENAAQSKARVRFDRLWLLMDSDCDNLLTFEETREAAPKILGKDLGGNRESVNGSWNETCIAWGKTLKLTPLQYLYSEILYASGIVWWTPCRVAKKFERIKKNYPELAVKYGANISYNQFQSIRSQFFAVYATYEKTWFRTAFDFSTDGCMSEAEYYRLMRFYCTCCHRQLEFSDECRRSAPNFMELLRATAPDGSVALKDLADNPSCVDDVWFAFWSIQLAAEAIPEPSTIQIALCHREVVAQVAHFEDQDAQLLIIGLALTFGFCSCACVCACLGLRRYYHQEGKDLIAAREVHKLLKAKIDTWSSFSSSLTCKMTDLRPTFKHYLGLDDPEMLEIDLLSLVHPEDSASLESSLGHIRNSHSNSMPVLTSVRFVYGARSEIRKQYMVQYVPVELLMVKTSEAGILVGVTALATIQPQAETLGVMSAPSHGCRAGEYDSASQVVSGSSQAEFILNGSDVAPSAQSDAITFRSMEASSHRGGQVTRVYNNLKQMHFDIQDVSLRLEATMEGDSKQSPEKDSKETSIGTRANDTTDSDSSQMVMI